MAVSSGSITTSNSFGYRNVTFSWSLQSQDVATNSTVIAWQIVGAQDGGDAAWYYAGPFNLTVNGVQVVSNLYPSGSRIELRKGTVVASGTATITHDSSTGAKTFSATLGAAVYDTVQRTVTGSWELPTIPRASTASVASAYNIGTSYTISISRKNSAFYHRVTYKYGTGAEQVIAASVATSATWNLTNWGSNIPAAMSASVTVYLRTYPTATDATNQTNQIGDTASYSVTLNVPSYNLATPTVAVAEGNSANTTGVYVQGVSKIKYTITATAQYGATLSYKVTVAGQTLSGGNTLTSDTIATSGTVTATITVTDSRGKTATTTASVPVKAYKTPTVSGTAVRSADGTSITCTATASASSILNGATEKNTMRVYALYSTTQSYPVPSAMYQFSTTGLSASGVTKTYTGLSASTTYYVRFYVEDLFGYYRFDVAVGTGGILHVTKTGIGILKRREHGALDVDGQGWFSGTVFPNAGIGGFGATGESQAYRIQPVRMLSYTDLGISSSAGWAAFVTAWLKRVCELYPTYSATSFVGMAQPNSMVMIQSYIYSCSTVDSNGLPQYAHGAIYHSGAIIRFSCWGYIVTAQTVYTDGSVIGVSNGGTGMTVSPSILADLGSTTAANVLQTSPRPGITGTLPIGHGGTGATSASGARSQLGVNQPTQLASASIAGNSSATLAVTTANYSFYLFKFTINSVVTTIFTTYSALATTAERYELDYTDDQTASVTITRAASGITVARTGSAACSVVLYGWT